MSVLLKQYIYNPLFISGDKQTANMLKFTLQNKRKAQNGSTSGSEAPGSPTAGSFTSSASSGSGHSRLSQDLRISGTVRRPSSLAPSDDSEGESIFNVFYTYFHLFNATFF